MFVSFDDAFKPKKTNKQIPEVVLEYLSSQLGSPSLKYISDDDGYCILTSTDGKLKLGGLTVEMTPDLISVLGDHPSMEDVQRYSYNAQKPISLKMQEEGYVFLNGQRMRIERLNFDPFNEVEYIRGTFTAFPKKMNEHIVLRMGGIEEEINMEFVRIPDNSLDWIAFQSEKIDYIKFVIRFNMKEQKLNYTVSYDFKKVKQTKDILIASDIYNAFISGEGKLNGVSLSINQEKKGNKAFSKEEIIFWKKILALEELLEIQFNAFLHDITNKDVYIIEVLYRSLINKVPVRIKENIVSLKGTAEIKNNEEVYDPNSPMAFHFQDQSEVNIFNQTFKMFGLKAMYNCKIGRLQEKDGEFELFIENESEEKRKYTVAQYFMSEEELLDFAQKHNVIQEFHDVKPVSEFYTIL